jgi:hypothetical protein
LLSTHHKKRFVVVVALVPRIDFTGRRDMYPDCN